MPDFPFLTWGEHSCTLLPMTTNDYILTDLLTVGGGVGWGWHYELLIYCSRLSFIIDLKRSIDLRWLFDPVLLFILRWSCFIPICLNSSPSPVRKCITREKVKLFISVLILSARLLARKLFLPYFTLIIINKRAPPPPKRDLNNNITDHDEEDGRYALIW